MRKNNNNKLNIAFLGIASCGHVTPTLPLVRALISLGCEVTYFNTEAFKNTINTTGAHFVDYNSKTLSNISILISSMEPHEITIELQRAFFKSTLEILPIIELHHAHKAFHIIIYDQMALWGQIFADQYNVLSVCSNTMFLFSTADILTEQPKLITSLDSTYYNELDLLKAVVTKVQSCKDILDIQTGTKADYIITYYPYDLLPTPPAFNNKKIIYLGNRFNSNYHASTAEFHNESIVYISLGTVFNEKLKLFTSLIESFNNTKYQVIVSTGNNSVAYNMLKNIEVTPNIHIYQFVNQLEILSKASLFITHAGFNSIYEGLYFTVPMLMIPHIPEQNFNASIVEKLKAGIILSENCITPNHIVRVMRELEKNWHIYKHFASIVRKSFLKSSNNLEVASKIKHIMLTNNVNQ